MRILPGSTVDINCLKGALLVSEHGSEYRCNNVSFELSTCRVLLEVTPADEPENFCLVHLEDLDDWSIQLSVNHH